MKCVHRDRGTSSEWVLHYFWNFGIHRCFRSSNCPDNPNPVVYQDCWNMQMFSHLSLQKSSFKNGQLGYLVQRCLVVPAKDHLKLLFYSARCYASVGISCCCVCLSVCMCLSHAGIVGIVSKRLHVLSWFFAAGFSRPIRYAVFYGNWAISIPILLYPQASPVVQGDQQEVGALLKLVYTYPRKNDSHKTWRGPDTLGPQVFQSWGNTSHRSHRMVALIKSLWSILIPDFISNNSAKNYLYLFTLFNFWHVCKENRSSHSVFITWIHRLHITILNTHS